MLGNENWSDALSQTDTDVTFEHFVQYQNKIVNSRCVLRNYVTTNFQKFLLNVLYSVKIHRPTPIIDLKKNSLTLQSQNE